MPVALPPFDNSSMDGYAVRVADVAGASEEFPAVLTVIGDVAAGSGELPTVGPGQAARIMTGAPLPPGAEAVVPVEWTDGGLGEGAATGMRARPARPPRAPSGEVRVHRAAEARAHVRARGSDVQAGDLRPGGRARSSARRRSPCSPPSAAAPYGCARARAWSSCPPAANWSSPARHWPRARSTTPTASRSPPPRGTPGAIAYRVGAVADDAETLRSTIEDQLIRADLLVTTGGVSVGAYDVVKEALSSRRATRTRPAQRHRLPQARHAARQAAGLRHHRPRPHPAARPARQPGVLVRLLRAVRAARDPRPDGPAGPTSTGRRARRS